MNRYFLFVLSMFVLSLNSCKKVTGEGPIRTEQRAVAQFAQLEMQIAGTIQFIQAPTCRVEVSAQQDILEVLKTDINDDKLIIRYKNNNWVSKREDVTVRVWAPDLKYIGVSSSGQVLAQDSVRSASLHLEVKGSGKIKLEKVIAERLYAEIGGSGKIHVGSGAVGFEKVRIAGSGNVHLSGVPAEEVQVRTEGSGTTHVHAIKKLDVNILGSGSVYYRGTPTVAVRVAGSGKLLAE